MSMPPLPDADLQCRALADKLRPHLCPETRLIGIHSGGAWIAKRLQTLLSLEADIGYLNISFYRDDFGKRGLHPQIKPSAIPFDIEGRPLILIDDVLYTGRTTRAAINELFDYGRPAKIMLGVLAERAGRELPISADFSVWSATLPPNTDLVLTLSPTETLAWRYEHHV